MDLERLVKFLNLTSSDSDNEALVALRMATKLLKKENTTWEKLLRGGGFSSPRIEYRERVIYKDRIVYQDRVVYRDRPTDQAQYANPDQSQWSSKSGPFNYGDPREPPREESKKKADPKPRADSARTIAVFAKLNPHAERMVGSTKKWYDIIRDFYNERGYITIRYLEMLEEFASKMV